MTGSCTVDFYVTSGSALSTVEWSGSVSASASTGYLDSGDINLALTAGETYAFSIGWDCDTTTYLGYNSNAPYTGADVGFGTVSGWISTNSYSGTFPTTFSTYTTGVYDQLLYVEF